MSLLRLAGRVGKWAEDVMPGCRRDAERLKKGGGEFGVSMMANADRWK